MGRNGRQQRSLDIVADLRRDITRGRYRPGARFPTRDDLEDRFGASRATVQKALDLLIGEGFVHAEGRRGTFVAERPPHLSEYGFAFGGAPSSTVRWSQFYAALRNEAQAMESGGELRFQRYYSVHDNPRGEDALRLEADVAAQRLAGVIYTYPPFGLALPAAAPKGAVPRVAIMDRDSVPGVCAVYPDSQSLLDRALEYLAGRGRTRVALVVVSQFRPEHVAHFRERAAQLKLTTGEQWIHGVCLCEHARTEVRNLVHLLMTSADARPDGLIIADDNFVEHASAGLVAAGARVGEDVDVVAHCNFPWPPPSVLPLKRLGFDIRALIRTCVEIIGRLRDGKKAPPATTIEAVFEDEVPVEPAVAPTGT